MPKVEALFGFDSESQLQDRTRISESGQTSTTSNATIAHHIKAANSLNEDTSDWPCPDLESCSYHRRPSWQEEEAIAARTDSNTGSSPVKTNTRIHNPFALSLHSLPPRSVSPAAAASASAHPPASHYNNTTRTTTLAVPQPHRNQKITFLSPFDNNNPFAVLPAPAVEAPLSPFCLMLPPSSPFSSFNSADNSNTTLLPVDMDSLSLPSSSPGLGTPSSMASTAGTSNCSCNNGPLDGNNHHRVVVPRQSSVHSIRSSDLSSSTYSMQGSTSASGSTSQHLSTSPTKPYYGTRSGSHGMPSTHAHSSFQSHQASDQCIQQQHNNDNLQCRRRSVDVGTLGNARGHQRNGRTSQADAPAAAFVPPDQLKAHRARKTNSQRNKEFLWVSILRHSRLPRMRN